MDLEQVKPSETKMTNPMIHSLGSTRPWTKFLSILGFITVALSFLMGISMIFIIGFVPQPKGVPTGLVGIIYVLLSLVYLFPSIYLFKYSSSIARFLNSKREIDMESALGYQKSFWKFTGIVGCIMIVIVILGILAAIIIPLVAGIRNLSGN